MLKHVTKSSLLFLILSFLTLKINAQSVGGTTATNGPLNYCSTTNSGYVYVQGYKTSILFWQSSTNGGITWVNIANTQPNQTYFNLGQTTCFRAVVQDGAFVPDTSTQICITIYQPAVAGSIIGGGTFCANAPAGTLALAGNTGTPAFWQYSETNGASWINIPNTTTSENYPVLTKNRLYRVVVQNGPTCKKDTSAVISFVISPTTFAGSVSGATSVCALSNAGTLTLAGNIGDVVSWQSSINSGTNWQTIANTTKTQNYNNLTQTTWYRAIVKSGYCNADTTNTAIIDVSAVTNAGTLSGDGNFCGTNASGTLTLAGNNGTIQNWLMSLDSGKTWSVVPNVNTTQTYSNLTATTWYGVYVKSGGCPADTSTIGKINVAPKTVAGTVSSSKSMCYGVGRDTLRLKGRVGRVLSWVQSIDNGANWTNIINESDSLIYNGLIKTTWYAAVVQSGYCDADTTAAVAITVFAQTPVDAGVSKTITVGQSVTLAGIGIGTPLWTPSIGLSDPASFTPIATPQETTTYTLFVTDSKNCVNSDTVTIHVLKLTYDGKITSLFTPNGDGINDTWYLENIQEFPDNEVIVYNIYGQEVFHKKAYANDWKGTYNGTDLPDGTYFYVLRFQNSETVFKGSIDILRNK
ncbi:MAG TPA: gliding motility-associated C-terminal domain-containing protein [Bacteroidia bacterium]|nr:gliding motility-associated C-terminal domain-containing protein [Bacteroidia bacterium]